jgi:hypothetical protein
MSGAAAVEDRLEGLLAEFRARAMASAPVRRLLAGWDRTVELRVAGEVRMNDAAPRAYFLRSQAGVMEGPAREAARRPDIVVSATAEVLEAIFGGRLNPARAHLDGDLAATGSQRDQLVLDSLVMLIWGL